MFKLRPELREQNEALNDPDDPQTVATAADDNGRSIGETDGGEIEANTTFHDLTIECTGANYGIVQRVKRFVSKIKVNSRNIAAGRIRNVTTEDNDLRYGDDESSESDNEEDLRDVVPLIRRNRRKLNGLTFKQEISSMSQILITCILFYEDNGDNVSIDLIKCKNSFSTMALHLCGL